ncbi:hypothetical protein LTR66_015831 [Elasticomyces elasticus]|nr:hypothetical protein LTR66_015831 [Elasticomyces elasticus]
MFMSALLDAAQLSHLGGCFESGGETCYEYSTDQTFNFHAPGLNFDYMSYAMYTLAQSNVSAMLDYTSMTTLAQKVFTTFFQHFASSNVPMNGTGGWRLAAGFTNELVSRAPSRVARAAAQSITARISEPIEELQMSPIAVYLCLVILTWLIVTTILIFILKNKYFSPLLQRVETIADVASLVMHSDCYLELARKKGATGLRKDKNFRTRLGWFRSRDGQVRWGIELADDQWVDWLDGEEMKTLRAS